MKRFRILSLILAALMLFAALPSSLAYDYDWGDQTPTPHNSAKSGDFAKTVLMPGDPLRAQWIAENMLTDAVLVNNVRGIQGYTGYYNGKRVSVMASGMGMPSMSIYCYELFSFYDVDTIIRIGTAGAINSELELFDVIIAQGACYDSYYLNSFGMPGTYAPIADFDLICKAVEECKKQGVDYKVGNILSSDSFYRQAGIGDGLTWGVMGVLAVEMETAALYANAAYTGKKALTLLTVSDLLGRQGVDVSAEDRETALTDMIKIALEIAE